MAAPAEGLRVQGHWLGIVTLRLVPTEGAEAPRRAFVWRHRPDGGGHGSGQAIDADGSVEFLGFRGAERLSIKVDGYIAIVLDLDVKPGERRELGDLALDPGVDVSGVVTDRAGTPVPDAEVSWGDFSDVAVTDEKGRFTVCHVAAGTVEVSAYAEGFVPLEGTIETKSPARLVFRRNRSEDPATLAEFDAEEGGKRRLTITIPAE